MDNQGKEQYKQPKVFINRGTSFKASLKTEDDLPRETTAPIEVEHPNKKKTVKAMEALLSVCLLAISFGVPIFFSGLAFQGITFEKQIYFYFWILLALVAWAVKGVIEGEIKIRRTPLDIPILGFLAIYSLAAIFSVDRWHSFWGFFGDPSRGLVGAFGLAILYYVIFSNFHLRVVARVLSAVLVSNFLMAVWMFLGVMNIRIFPDSVYQIAPMAPVGSFSGSIIFFAAMIPLLMTALFKVSHNQRINRILGYLLTSFLLVSLILNLLLLLALFSFATWIGWVAITAGIILFLVYLLSRVVKLSDYAWSWLPMAVFGIIVFFLLGGSSLPISRIGLPLEISLDYSSSAHIAKNSLWDNFFLGSGPATYGYDFSLHKSKEFNLQGLYGVRFYQGSGLFFELISTAGALGVFFFTLIALSFLSVCLYLLTREKEKNKIYSLGLFSSSVILLISAVTLKMDGSMIIISALMAALALATVLKESGSEEKYLDLSLKASPKFALAFAFVFTVVSAGVVFIFVYVGRIYVADALIGMAGKNSVLNEETAARILRGIALHDKESRYYIQLAQSYSVMANSEALKGEGRDVSKVQAYLNNSIVAANRAGNLSKNDAATIEALAQIYENSGLYVPESLNLAEENYRKALELEPRNPGLLLKIGQIKVILASSKKEEEKKQMIEDAKGLFQASVDEKDNFSAGYYQLALAKETLGDLDGSISSLEQAYVLDRNNINYSFHLGRMYLARGKEDDYKISEAFFSRAAQINNKEPNVYIQLGVLYEKMKENGKAIDEYRKAFDLVPENEKEAREKISEMIGNVKNGTGNDSEGV